MLSNRAASLEEGKNVYDKLNSVVEQFLDGKIDYLGMIPQDMMLEKSVRQQKPVSINVPEARSSKAFEVMAVNLLENEHNLPNIRWGIAQVFSDLINRKQ